jgi:polyhydroxyalkanoate synthesis regulator phasin
MRTKPKTVGFQLDEEYLKRLEEEAAKHKMSAGQYARRLVMDALDDTERKVIKEEVSELNENVEDLRLCLADSVEAILTTLGASEKLVISKEQAREWVDENIRAAR